MPIHIDPRCPRIVRNLLSLSGNWYHGATRYRSLRKIAGFDSGETLATEISMKERTVPIIVVGTCDGEVALPSLDERLAYDLSGHANVVVIDSAAAWALTDAFGSAHSCFNGGVRIYWPHFTRFDDRRRHPLWTLDRLRSTGQNLSETRERFRKQLRSMLFKASALSVIRPREIDDIRNTVRLRPLKDLREKATSLEEYKELADSYASDNDTLQHEVETLQSEVERLEKVANTLQSERDALQYHLSAANSSSTEVDASEDIAPDTSNEVGAEIPSPTPGETRYYKKKFPAPSHDIMIRVQSCNHNKWENANKGDKAEKGIIKLEGGRSDWKRLQHCAACTGGGHWKVIW